MNKSKVFVCTLSITVAKWCIFAFLIDQETALRPHFSDLIANFVNSLLLVCIFGCVFYLYTVNSFIPIMIIKNSARHLSWVHIVCRDPLATNPKSGIPSEFFGNYFLHLSDPKLEDLRHVSPSFVLQLHGATWKIAGSRLLFNSGILAAEPVWTSADAYGQLSRGDNFLECLLRFLHISFHWTCNLLSWHE